MKRRPEAVVQALTIFSQTFALVNVRHNIYINKTKISHNYLLVTTSPCFLYIEPAGISSLRLKADKYYSLPTIVPGLSTLPQPTSTLSPRKAPIFLIPVSILQSGPLIVISFLSDLTLSYRARSHMSLESKN